MCLHLSCRCVTVFARVRRRERENGGRRKGRERGSERENKQELWISGLMYSSRSERGGLESPWKWQSLINTQGYNLQTGTLPQICAIHPSIHPSKLQMKHHKIQKDSKHKNSFIFQVTTFGPALTQRWPASCWLRCTVAQTGQRVMTTKVTMEVILKQKPFVFIFIKGFYSLRKNYTKKVTRYLK